MNKATDLAKSGKKHLDDGNYNDGLANDGLYGAKIPNSSNMIDYYLYADNDSSGAFSPERAAYEFYNIKSNSLQPGDIVINELMSNNTSYISDPSGDFEDWIELYNPNSYPISTMGLFLTDTLAQIHKWDFPNYTIPANSYAIIWADEDGGQGNRHANFKLSNLGECVILSNLDSIIIDSITYTTQSSNMSFSRMPNGLGPFVIQYPTFNKNNNLSTVIDDIQHTLNIYPNPTSSEFTVNVNHPKNISISRRADSAESDPCTRFSVNRALKSPRIVPGSA